MMPDGIGGLDDASSLSESVKLEAAAEA